MSFLSYGLLDKDQSTVWDTRKIRKEMLEYPGNSENLLVKYSRVPLSLFPEGLFNHSME